MSAPSHAQTWGLMAEFASAEDLLSAAHEARRAGYRHAEAYSPFPIEGLSEALGSHPAHVPAWTFFGGLLGAVSGFFMQWFSATVAYPEHVGGRPLNSWPMFVPVTFEMTILFAAIAAVAAMLIGNGLPSLYHPVFNAPDFDLASRNRFFLCLRCDDPGFDPQGARQLLERLHALRCMEVPA
ncbi:MAG: DUF3341 domain-containing protein [Aquabacterium sp.]